jgi:uncharacterized phiE125 gp8 family phage protein
MALASWALLTLDEVKEWLEVEDYSSDVLLERLIEATSLAVEALCGRKLASRTYTDELYCGTGTRWLTLREFPVTSVTSIEFLQSVSASGSTWDDQDRTSSRQAVLAGYHFPAW